ncbi:MAG: ArgE/DapE family deacylase [Methylocystaceae bacterium]|nr:ArgE/DapE family deacylase [Methylocystaceae bacterium]
METELRHKIRSAVHEHRDDAIDLLSQLVRHDSTLGNESEAQETIASRFRSMGLQVKKLAIDLEQLSVLPGFSPPASTEYGGGENVIGIHQPRTFQGGKSLILNGHMDVVPTGAAKLWSRPPFEPYVIDDWLYGRGSGDMKAGIVAYCMAFQALRDIGYQPAAPVILQSVVEEECTGNGALACLHAGYTADAAIIPEPFAQTLMVAQLGVMWFEVNVTGVPAHVLNTSNGNNAIEAAYALFEGLRELEKEWNSDEAKHPSFTCHDHPINFNLGRITGGDWASSVPSSCSIDVRIGFYPGMSLLSVREKIESSIQETLKKPPSCENVTYEIRYHGFQAEGCTMDRDHPMMTQLAKLHHEVTGYECKDLASTATTDARFFQIYGGIPATCYGPLAENIHGIDERVSLKSMIEVAEVLALFIADWCGLEPIAND